VKCMYAERYIYYLNQYQNFKVILELSEHSKMIYHEQDTLLKALYVEVMQDMINL
jgi:sRNA-binding regulator protein Hfq